MTHSLLKTQCEISEPKTSNVTRQLHVYAVVYCRLLLHYVKWVTYKRDLDGWLRHMLDVTWIAKLAFLILRFLLRHIEFKCTYRKKFLKLSIHCSHFLRKSICQSQAPFHQVWFCPPLLVVVPLIPQQKNRHCSCRASFSFARHFKISKKTLAKIKPVWFATKTIWHWKQWHTW